jgi:hypothetical protein
LQNYKKPVDKNFFRYAVVSPEEEPVLAKRLFHEYVYFCSLNFTVLEKYTSRRMPDYLKITQVFFLAMIKYFYAPLYGVAIGMKFWETFFSLIAGGSLAFSVYYYFTDLVLIYSRHFSPYFIKIIPQSWQRSAKRRKVLRRIKRRNRKKFTWRTKFVVKLRRGYGMWGIILLTPVLLSLPIGAFLLRKYYRQNKMSFPYMIASIVIEGFVLCVAYWKTAGLL